MASRRDRIRMSEQELHRFLDEQRIVQIATAGPHGRPHLMPLWYVPDGTQLLAWTYAASQKARNLERDPRATCSIDDGVQYQELRGAMMECDVTLEHDPERVAEIGAALLARYGGAEELATEAAEMVRAQAAKRVGLRFSPTRIVTWDHRKLEGKY